MRSVKIFGSVPQLCFALVCLCWLGALVVRADYYVRPSATCTNTDLQSPYDSWDTAATNIQWAVDVATTNAPTTVWVSNGTYCLTNQIVITNNITVQSTNGYSNTLVYAGWPEYTTRCFYVSHTGVVDGFTISNGHYVGSNDYYGGGGAFITTNGMIKNSYFTENVCSNAGYFSGGGGALINADGVVSNCVFYRNRVGQPVGGSDIIIGGGIFITPSPGMVLGCTIVSNGGYPFVYCAGGIAISHSGSSPSVISDCLIFNNADSAGVFTKTPDTRCEIADCTISGHAWIGLRLEGSYAWVRNCFIVSNNITGVFGGYVRMTNCVIAYNRNTYTRHAGAGIQFWTDSIADNCWISNNISIITNGVGGCSLRTGGTLRNCLIHHNTNNSTLVAAGGVYMTNAA